MYMAITRWEFIPGREADFERVGKMIGNILRQQSGVRMVETVRTDKGVVAVHIYDDEATYRRLVHDPNSDFARAVAENHVDDLARWVGTDSGDAQPHH